jgi:nucleotide-binding universal stress UspA family protein
VTAVETLIRVGQPARTIVHVAEQLEVDCIVMGSRGLGDFEGLLLGSVSHKVASLAKCTCVTVK